MTGTDESALKFPCQFPIKAMGRAEHDIKTITLEILRRHAPDQDDFQVRIQDSSNGNFVSVTVTVVATSREQLDAIYQDLSSHSAILMSL